ncbi:MAG: DNA adenine methylase [Bacteroidales bacterium]|jgi:DNA adenine methylase|nr:DNA adenine methylase [Bacteroidales bacterium]
MGSKNKLAKELLPLILRNRKSNQWYVEPFCGGCNMIDKVKGNRIGSDVNEYLIEFLKYVQTNIPFDPPNISEKDYIDIKNNKDNYPKWLVGYVGFNLSFGAKFFGGYRRDKAGQRDYQNEAQQNIKAQQENLIGIDFVCCSYDKLEIPNDSIIYCDPPYRDTTKYKDCIDYEKFYNWCIQKQKDGHKVFISEYWMPEPFKCVYEKNVSANLSVNLKGITKTEKLYTLENVVTLEDLF